MDKPTVSVWMITYNHEKFIAQAIESILEQKTNFSFEFVIGEDFSNDNTATIVKEYAKKYPEIIKARFNNPNLGIMSNVIKTLEECNGKYIALCEGDDYWTDHYKLQKQVDFLEANPDVIMCYTDIEKLYKNGEKHIEKYQEEMTFIEIIKGNLPATPTMMIRNDKSLIFFLEGYIDKFYGDRMITYWCIKNGRIKNLREVTAIYRIHDGGMWGRNNSYEIHQNTIKYLHEFHNIIGNPNNGLLTYLDLSGRFYFLYKSFCNKKINIKIIMNELGEIKNRNSVFQILIAIFKICVEKLCKLISLGRIRYKFYQ